METYMWLILASMLAVGMLIGFFIGRTRGDTSAPRVKELEETLSKANEEMQSYRGQVSQHFEKTANLFNQLTNDYREVYEHLANSSEQLCSGEQMVKLKSLSADKKVLEGEGQVESQAEEKTSAEQEEAPAAEKKTAPAEEQSKSEEPFVPPAAEQKGDEARTVH